jgi:outer membrane immunogenic protein
VSDYWVYFLTNKPRSTLLGFLLTPATLFYATGGVAWQHREVTSTSSSSSCGAAAAIVTDSSTKPGWTAGGGIETRLWGPWLARAEYLYADFGTAPVSISQIFFDVRTVDNFNVKLRTHTVNFGLAYKFN